MIKLFFSLLLLLFSGFVLAGAACEDIPGKQRHVPLKIKGGIVCFIEEPLLDEKSRERYADAISVYFIPRGLKPVEAEGLGMSYDYDAGKIVEAFTLDVDRDGKNEVVVIHSFGIRHTQAEPNSSGEVYDVIVFSNKKNILSRNDRATEWFGRSYSWFSDGKKVIYKFPYQTRHSVQQAMASPFSIFIVRDEVIPVIVKRKNFLYKSSYGEDITKKYLIAGDKGTVDKSEKGLCRITYTGGKQPLQMWIMCDALEVDKKGKEQ